MPQVTEHLLAALALFFVWKVADHFIEAPIWAWWIALAGGGITMAVLLDDRWWLGVGFAGAALLLMGLLDLLTLATDWAKVSVLRAGRR